MNFYSLYKFDNNSNKLFLTERDYLRGGFSTSSTPNPENDYHNTSSYYKNLEEVTNDLIYYINYYRKNEYDITKPINMNCNYNIFIYEVKVWEKKDSNNIKIYPIKKAIPKSTKNIDKINKYLELCDQKDMNVAKLCLAMYGQNLTEQQLKDIENKHL